MKIHRKIHRKILELFKTNKSYYPKDYYYERLLNKYDNLESYLSIINLNNKQALLTDRNIGFSDSELFKKNERRYLKKRYGKPNYVIVNKYPFGKITILFYRVNIAGQKVKMELHFFQNSLFIYNYTFSYFKDINEKNNVVDMIKKKYRIDKGKDLILNSYIMDKNMSVIVLSDSVYLTINYIFNINSNLFHKMDSYLNEKKERNNKIIKRKKRELYRRL